MDCNPTPETWRIENDFAMFKVFQASCRLNSMRICLGGAEKYGPAKAGSLHQAMLDYMAAAIRLAEAHRQDYPSSGGSLGVQSAT